MATCSSRPTPPAVTEDICRALAARQLPSRRPCKHGPAPPRGRRRLKDGRWQLGFEARIALERSAEDAQAEDASVPALQVRVLAIDIENREDWDGDALIDSWLHTGDLLAEVEALIDDKLQDAVAETTGNPDDHAASRWL